jgi:hypothetical protein
MSESPKKKRQIATIEPYSIWSDRYERGATSEARRKAEMAEARKVRSTAVSNESAANESPANESPANESPANESPGNESNEAAVAGPPVLRSTTGLSRALEVYTDHGTRKKYERHSVPDQCKYVIGPPGPKTTCWLCGFPIGKWAQISERSDGEQVFMPRPMLDRAVCEHVLPVKLGHGVLELLYLARDPISEQLLHTEYEYAHNHCNYIKNEIYFVTLPLDATNFCELQVQEERIDKVLELIYFGERGQESSSQASVLWVKMNEDEEWIRFPNPVQAYCYSENSELFLADPEAYYEEVWKPRTKRLILAKMARVLGYIKLADFCNEAEAVANERRGAHFAGLAKRLEKGLPALNKSKFKVRNATTGKLVTQYPGRVLARSPSFSNILTTVNASQRPAAFESSNVVGRLAAYLANNSVLNARETAVSDAALAAAGAGAFSNFVEATPVKKTRRVRKVNTSPASTTRNNSISYRTRGRVRKEVNANEEELNLRAAAAAVANALAAAGANMRNSPAMRTRSRLRNIGSNRTRVARGRLTAEEAANGIYISGNTYPVKNTLKELGGVWVPTAKKWKVPLGTNISGLGAE